MQIPKPTEADKTRFRSLVPDDPRVETKPMFGNLGAFVNGNMFMGLYGDQIGIKLGPEDAAELARIEGSGPFGPAERPMGGYLTLPPGFAGMPEAAQWVSRSLDFIARRPPKGQSKGQSR